MKSCQLVCKMTPSRLILRLSVVQFTFGEAGRDPRTPRRGLGCKQPHSPSCPQASLGGTPLAPFGRYGGYATGILQSSFLGLEDSGYGGSAPCPVPFVLTHVHPFLRRFAPQSGMSIRSYSGNGASGQSPALAGGQGPASWPVLLL